MTIKRCAQALALLGALPTTASAWRAINQHDVYQISPGVYEVVSEPGSGAVDFWCGIGDFGRMQLNLGATQKIYVWRGLGPSVTRPERAAVQFALNPPSGSAVAQGYGLSVKQAGDSLSASFARQYCSGSRFDPFEQWID